MTQPIPRRTVAKGAAWAAPAIAFAGAAPVFAASAFTVVCPPAATVMKLEGASPTPAVTSYLAGSTYKGGTYATISAGEWIVPATTTTAGSATTGYYLNWGSANTNCDSSNGTSAKDAVHIVTQAGASAVGQLTLSTPVGCSPQTAGAGLEASLGIQYSAPYSLDSCATGSGGKAMEIKNISIPFSITYLTGLKGSYTSASNTCGYYLNMTFSSGCQPNYMTASSITTTPLY